MKTMRDVWIGAAVGALAAALLWFAFWQSSGADMKAGRLGDTALGVWVIFTQKGSMVWLPALLGAVLVGGIVFLVGRTSYQNRVRESLQAADAAERPHPMG